LTIFNLVHLDVSRVELVGNLSACVRKLDFEDYNLLYNKKEFSCKRLELLQENNYIASCFLLIGSKINSLKFISVLA